MDEGLPTISSFSYPSIARAPLFQVTTRPVASSQDDRVVLDALDHQPEHFEHGGGLAARFLHAPALRDVNDRAEDQAASPQVERLQADLERELRAVLPAPAHVPPPAHAARVGGSQEDAPLPDVLPSEGEGEQRLNRLAHELGALVAEERLDDGVHEDNLSLIVNREDARGHPLEHATEALLARRELRGALGDAHLELVVGPAERGVRRLALADVAVCLEHVGPVRAADQDHARLHRERPSVAMDMGELPLPGAPSPEDLEERVHSAGGRGVGPSWLTRPTASSGECRRSLGALVPEGDGPVPGPDEDGVVGLIDERRLARHGDGRELRPHARFVHPASEQRNPEARDGIEREAHDLVAGRNLEHPARRDEKVLGAHPLQDDGEERGSNPTVGRRHEDGEEDGGVGELCPRTGSRRSLPAIESPTATGAKA